MRLFSSSCFILALLLGVNTAPAQDSSSVRLLGSIYHNWDATHEVVTVGNYAYVATGYSGIQAIDLSNPEEPRLAGFTDGQGPISNLAVAGDLLVSFMCEGRVEAWVTVYDLENPTSPQPLSSMSVPYHPMFNWADPGLAANEDYVFVSLGCMETDYGWVYRLIVLGIERNDDEVSLRDVFQLEEWNEYFGGPLLVSGDLLFEGGENFRIWDVSDPGEPSVAYHAEWSVYGMTMFEDLLILSGGGRIRILDISNPAEPEEVSLFEVAVGSGLEVSDTYLFTLSGNMLNVVDISSPRDPEIVASLDVELVGTDIALAGETAVVLTREPGVTTVDVGSPHEPAVLGRYNAEAADIKNAAVSGQWAWITRGASMIQAVDVSDPEHPQEAGSLEMPETVRELDIAGEWLTATCSQSIYEGGTTLHIIDPNDPDSLRILGEYALDAPINGMACDRRYAYLVTDRETHIVDLSDPEHPAAVDTLLGGDDIKVYGNRAYVMGFLVYAYDIADRRNPRLLGSYRLNDFRRYGGFDIYDDWLCYVSFYDWGPHGETYSVYLTMADISGQDPPRQGRTIDLPSTRETQLMAMWDGIAFIRIEGILSVWDMRAPEQMRELCWLRTPGCPRDMALAGELAYLADETNFGIYDCSDFLSAPPSSDFIQHPSSYNLYPAYPNPFNASTVISFSLPVPGLVTLAIYDQQGRQVAELVNGLFIIGIHKIGWDAADATSGIYLVRMETGSFCTVQKAILVK